MAVLILSRINLSAQSTRYTIAHYSDESGLPQNSVKAITSDKNGFIWLATEEGLVRFDGKSFQTFNRSTLPLRSSRINYFILKENELHAVTTNHQLIRVNDTTSLPDGVFPANKNPALPYYEGTTIDTFYAHGFPDFPNVKSPVKVYDVPLGNDSFYRCSADQVVLYVRGHTISTYPINTENLPGFFCFNGKLFYYSGNNFSVLNDGHLNKIAPGKQLAFMLLNSKKYGLFWNNVADQLFIYDAKTLYQLSFNTFGVLDAHLLLDSFNFIDHQIATAYFNPDGLLFLGSVTNGLYVARANYFHESGTRGSANISYYGFTQWRDDHTILAAGGNILDIPVNRPAKKPVSAGFNFLTGLDKYTILYDKTNKSIWTKETNNFFKIDAITLRLSKHWILPSEINQLYEGEHHVIYIATKTEGIYSIKYDKTTAAPVATLPAPQDVTYMLQTSATDFFAGTTNGLHHINLANKRSELVSGTQNMYVRSLMATAADELWITTYEHGFHLLSKGHLTTFPKDENGYLSCVHGILQDAHNNFWITTNKGLFQVRKQDLLNYAAQKQKQVYYAYYNNKDGLPSNEFNGGCQPSGVVLGNGNFAFPSLNGVVYFKPQEISPLPPNREIFIYRVNGNKALTIADTLLLDKGDRKITLQITTPFYGNQKNLRLEYRFEKERPNVSWNPLPEDHTIHFESISTGIHHLTVRNLNGPGGDSYTMKTLVINMPLAYYETWWFRVIMFLAAGGIIIIYISFHFKKVKRLNEALELTVANRTSDLQQMLQSLKQSETELKWQAGLQEKIITAITHDVKTPLKYVALAAAKIEELLAQESYNDVILFSKGVHDSSMRIYHLIDDLVGYMKVNLKKEKLSNEEVDLYQLIDDKISIFSNIAVGEKNVFINDISPQSIVWSNYQLLSIIVHNLLDNAAKNTAKGIIRISTDVKEDQLHLIISDTGYGMPESIKEWLNHPENVGAKAQGLGLLIVKEVAVMINVTIEAYSSAEHGTSIDIVFPK